LLRLILSAKKLKKFNENLTKRIEEIRHKENVEIKINFHKKYLLRS